VYCSDSLYKLIRRHLYMYSGGFPNFRPRLHHTLSYGASGDDDQDEAWLRAKEEELAQLKDEMSDPQNFPQPIGVKSEREQNDAVELGADDEEEDEEEDEEDDAEEELNGEAEVSMGSFTNNEISGEFMEESYSFMQPAAQSSDLDISS